MDESPPSVLGTAAFGCARDANGHYAGSTPGGCSEGGGGGGSGGRRHRTARRRDHQSPRKVRGPEHAEWVAHQRRERREAARDLRSERKSLRGEQRRERAALARSHDRDSAKLDRRQSRERDRLTREPASAASHRELAESHAQERADITSEHAAARRNLRDEHREAAKDQRTSHLESVRELRANQRSETVETLREILDRRRYERELREESGGIAAMSKLNAKQRSELPESDFGDGDRRLFPVVDQDDVDSAAHLIGKAKNPDAVRKRITAIARRKGLKIPDAWKDDAKMSAVAAFDLGTPREDGDYVLYENSLIFRPGEYADRQFEMTPEEAWAAVEQFTDPVPNEIEHVNTSGIATILDGKLGDVRAIRLSDDATEIRGTVAIPRWLDSIWEGPKSVSAVWDRSTKSLRKLGLVMKGRVPGAALMAAFCEAHPDAVDPAFAAAHMTPHGQVHLQQIHDMAATVGAVCDPANTQDAGDDDARAGRGSVYSGADGKAADPGNPGPSATFVSARERTGIQKIHDLAAQHGAKCAVTAGKAGGRATMSVGAAPTPPAPTPPIPPATPARKEKKPMSLKDSFLALFGKAEAPPASEAAEAFLADLTADVARAVPVPTPAAPASFADSPEAKDMRAEIEKLREQARGAAEKQAKFELDARHREIAAEAAAFADGEIKALRALPNERANLVAMFTQMALDDLANPSEVTFAAGAEIRTGTRVESLRATSAARPTHNLFMNMLGDRDLPPVSAVFAARRGDEDRRPDESEVDRLLAMTDVGRRALALKAGRNGNGNGTVRN